MMSPFRKSSTTALLFAASPYSSLHHHPWLPFTSNQNFQTIEKLQTILQNSNITKIGFLRHGNTGKAENDFDRVLTETGRQQAIEAGKSFGKTLQPFFHRVLVSPAPRTMETAQLFVDETNTTASTTTSSLTKLFPVDVIYDGTMQPQGGILFRKIGYAPLTSYLGAHDENDKEQSRLILGGYANSIIETILDIIKNNDDNDHESQCAPEPSTTLMIVGHAIYLPAAALGVASLINCNDTNLILSTNTKEAEGYLIDVTHQSVELLCRPSTLNDS